MERAHPEEAIRLRTVTPSRPHARRDDPGHPLLGLADVLYDLAWHLARNRVEAEDLVQEAFARALRSWGQFTPGTDLKAWVLRILRNAWLDRCRHERRSPVAPAAGEDPEEGAPPPVRGRLPPRRRRARAPAGAGRERHRERALESRRGAADRHPARPGGADRGGDVVGDGLPPGNRQVAPVPGPRRAARPSPGLPEVGRAMDCIDARTDLVGLLRGRLARPEQDALHAHLSGCEPCRQMEATERALDDLLDRELPRRQAPASLRQRLEGMARRWRRGPRRSPPPSTLEGASGVPCPRGGPGGRRRGRPRVARLERPRGAGGPGRGRRRRSPARPGGRRADSSSRAPSPTR